MGVFRGPGAGGCAWPSHGNGVVPGQPVLGRFRPEPPGGVGIPDVGPRQGVLARVRAAPDGAAVGVAGRPHGRHHAHVGVPVRVAEPGYRLAAGRLEHGAAVFEFRGQRRPAGTGQRDVAQPVRADLHARLRGLAHLAGGHQRLARTSRVPGVHPTEAGRERKHGRGEAIPGQHRQGVMHEVGVAVVEREADEAARAVAGAGAEQFSDADAAQAASVQPAHLLPEPNRADRDQVGVVGVGTDRVIHEDSWHHAAAPPDVPGDEVRGALCHGGPPVAVPGLRQATGGRAAGCSALWAVCATSSAGQRSTEVPGSSRVYLASCGPAARPMNMSSTASPVSDSSASWMMNPRRGATARA